MWWGALLYICCIAICCTKKLCTGRQLNTTVDAAPYSNHKIKTHYISKICNLLPKPYVMYRPIVYKTPTWCSRL